ncbi:MAG: MmgE/PrpD family protein [Negativicutes bacterium]
MSDMEISQSCIDFAYSFKLEDAPADTRDHMKKCLLDWLGCAIRGSVMSQADCIKKYVTAMGGNAQASIIGDSTMNSVFNAALSNGYYGHILEMDDVDKESITHPGTVVIPAALSIGEWNRLSGADFLAAMIAGYEVMLRVGAAVTPAHYQIWHTTATSGVFGSVVAAGRMLKLTKEELTWAFGNAGTLSAGLWEFLQDGAMSKYLHAGKASATGVMTAYLAGTGFTGATRILEGKQGFFAGYARQEVNPELFADFRQRYRAGTVSFKPYPCCRHTHSTIDCARALHGQLINPLDTVKSIRISTYKAAVLIAGTENPQDSRQAQFSLKYVVSRALKIGNIGLSDFDDNVLFDPEVRKLMEKVTVEVDPQIDSLTPAAWPSRVTVDFVDGHSITEYVQYPKGDPENSLEWAEVKGKFTLLVNGILDRQGTSEVISVCENIESVDDCGQLLKTVNKYGVF